MLIRYFRIINSHGTSPDMLSQFFEWQELIWLHHFVSYEYFRIMILHCLNFGHFNNLENWVFWTYWELTCSFRSILSSDLGLNSFESCFTPLTYSCVSNSVDLTITDQHRRLHYLESLSLEIASSHWFFMWDDGAYLFSHSSWNGIKI